MSDIKERILGAVTVMSDSDARILWKIIIDNFTSLDDVEEEEPDEIDMAMLEQIKNDPDCGVFVSEEEAMKELGLA